jgi:uncharacterized membrane protein
MSGLPLLPLIGLGVLFLAAPLALLLLILYVVSLRLRVMRLESRVAELEARRSAPHAGPAPAATPGAAAPATAGPPAPYAVEAPGPPPATGSARAATVPAAAPFAARATAETAARLPGETVSPPPPGPSGAGEGAGPGPRMAPAGTPGSEREAVSSWEGRVGGTWLSRVGALLLVLGTAFFLRHAFENEWIGPAGRVAIGCLAGIVLVAGGGRLARRPAYRVPAHALVAVGIGVLYLSLYAAHAFYELLTAPVAFAAMAAVTATAFAIALRLDARALAALALLGGLLTPALLESDMDAARALFPYVAILDAGVLVAAGRRGWPGLALTAWVGTELLYWGWLERRYDAAQLPVALGWATAFFLGFAAAAWRGSRLPGPGGAVRFTRAVLVLGAPAAYFLAARRVLDGAGGWRLTGVALGLAALYLVAARLAARRDERGIALFHGAVALAFLAVAPAAALDRHDLTIAWVIEGLVLVWGGFRLGAPRLRAAGLLLQALAWGRWFAALGEDGGRAGVFLLAHPALPATVAIAAIAGLAAGLYAARERVAAPLRSWERLARPGLCLVAIGSVALLLTLELDQFRTLAVLPPFVPVVKAVVWMLAGVVVLALARTDPSRLLLSAATALLIVLAGEALAEAGRWGRIPLHLRPAVWNPRFLAGCLLVVLTWLYGQVAGSLPYLGERTRRSLGSVAAAAAALLLLWNLTAEVLLMPLPATRLDPGKLRSAAVSILWAVYAVVAMAWGLVRGRGALRVGAMLLFAATVVKVLIVDLADLDALYRILSVLILGAALVLASFLYARARQHPRQST